MAMTLTREEIKDRREAIKQRVKVLESRGMDIDKWFQDNRPQEYFDTVDEMLSWEESELGIIEASVLSKEAIT